MYYYSFKYEVLFHFLFRLVWTSPNTKILSISLSRVDIITARVRSTTGR